MTVMQTLDFISGLHNCLEFSQPLSCLTQAMQTENVFYCLNITKRSYYLKGWATNSTELKGWKTVAFINLIDLQ